MFKLGAKIIYVKSVWISGTETRVITQGIVTRVSPSTGTVWIDNQHKAEDCMFAAFIYPDIPESMTFLEKEQAMIARHKREREEFLSDTFAFNNELVRNGLK